MSTAFFRIVLAASLFTLAALFYFVGKLAGVHFMDAEVFATLRVVAAVMWVCAIVIRCTEVILKRIDESDLQAAAHRKLATKDEVARKEHEEACATLAQLGGSRTRRSAQRAGVLAPVD